MIKILYNKNEYSGPLVTVFVLNWNRKEEVVPKWIPVTGGIYFPDTAAEEYARRKHR